MPVITGATNNIPDSFDTLGQRQENAAVLRRAGVEMTLGAATILGIADHVGSLAAGKDANVVVWSGDPLRAVDQRRARYRHPPRN